MDYSGGTMSTAFVRGAVDTLNRVGYRVKQNRNHEKQVFLSVPNQAALLMFSKKYDNGLNP